MDNRCIDCEKTFKSDRHEDRCPTCQRLDDREFRNEDPTKDSRGNPTNPHRHRHYHYSPFGRGGA